jgi:hypothetical protein
MIDRWTDTLFWPALGGAWIAMLVAVAAAIMPEPFLQLVVPATTALGIFAGAMFVLMLFDLPTRRAVDTFNRKARTRWPDMTWSQRFLSPEYGDRRLLIVNRLVWVVAVVCIFAKRQDLALLCFVSFALSTIMLMLMMKRHLRS